MFLTSVGAGSSIWCTHFIAILAFEPGAPVSFDPALTILSLLLAVSSTALGLIVATSGVTRLAPAVGGSLVGLAIAAMHYIGMKAYHIAGLVSWDESYVLASVGLAALLAGLALHVALQMPGASSRYVAAGLLVLAIVSLHFTGMAAISVTPMLADGQLIDPSAGQAMALAVAAVGLLIVGTGLASYLIDDQTRLDTMAHLQHLALNDTLTDLPNRAGFNEHLDREFERAKAAGTRLAVICMDLDRFKEINDLRGHRAGDITLQTIAGRMRALLGDGEFVARLGGDEFAAVKRMQSQDDLLDFMARLETALFAPFNVDGSQLSVGASLGVAVYPEDADSKEGLNNGADLAMYRAKSDVNQVVCFYEHSMDDAVRARRSLASDLRQAVANEQLEVHYQVQTSLSSGEVTGFEALLRWKHPNRGFVPPSEFIPLAEESGLILSIGEWVLRTACTQAASWHPAARVAVNISPIQFAHADLPGLIQRVLHETGLPAPLLEVEITETAIFADKLRGQHILERIKALGVSIAIDDFGTGYSSFETLRNFPFDKIKLDRSFVSEIETSLPAKAIVRAVLALGRSLGIQVLAEGVETPDQLMLLIAEGCDEVQGYLLGRPMPSEMLFRVRNQVLSALLNERRSIAAKVSGKVRAFR